MVHVAADQNLLFGIIALQMDFITRDALLAAMSAWVLRKEDSLGTILVEKGALTQQHHELLLALVKAHLHQHFDDPEKCLATLNALAPIQRELEKIADPDVQASLAQVTQRRESDSAATAGPAAATSNASGMRYRILRPHARGGLGLVHVAFDEELHREVALKEIQEHHASNPDSRARFLLEAEITGGLEHPGVVPVYGLGLYSDGRPYYAMRFIRGDSLKDAIARFHRGATDGSTTGRSFTKPHTPDYASLEFRQLLGRFVSVCQAIQYAHDRGILHRDLKPSNIMLGKYGETLVVDWGLAKAVGKSEAHAFEQEPTLRPSSASGSAETLPGSAMGTPAYMSPEQAAGNLDQLGPATDVYSLGATLFCILVGGPPFDDPDVGVILQRVQRGDFLPPRYFQAHIPRPLEAICLKAMALAPTERYGAAQLLAEDVEQWLGDEPVSACAEPWTQRLARWARRHRVLVEVAAFALVIVVICSTLAAMLLGRQAQQEYEGRLVAEQLREKGLRVAAQFAARTIAYEIDLRWWILKGAADDAELRQLVRALTPVEQPKTDPAWQSLQAWTKDRFTESARTRATAWFVADHKGRHLARHPPDEKLVGKSFAFRDYFHGLGRDFPEGASKEPIRDVHRSIVFESQATGNRMVTFSVPIWSGQPRASEILGVLGMSVELGEFAGLRIANPNGQDEKAKDRIAVLVDGGEDWLEGRAQKGLILQHPWLEEMRRVQPGKIPLLRLEPSDVERIETLRQLRLRNEASFAADELDRAYLDPAGGAYGGLWLAAFEPVIIEGRSEKAKDTGWVVIVQER